jgi:hypothetical protein
MPYSITDEERERRRERARQLHAEVDPETGLRKFGGRQPGSGRPRKVRAAELVADAAQREAKEIAKVFKDAIQPNQPAAIRLQAAKQWLEIENKEATLQMQEDKALAQLSHDELLERVATSFARLAGGGHMDPMLTDMMGEPVQGGQIIELGEEGYEVVDDDDAA